MQRLLSSSGDCDSQLLVVDPARPGALSSNSSSRLPPGKSSIEPAAAAELFGHEACSEDQFRNEELHLELAFIEDCPEKVNRPSKDPSSPFTPTRGAARAGAGPAAALLWVVRRRRRRRRRRGISCFQLGL